MVSHRMESNTAVEFIVRCKNKWIISQMTRLVCYLIMCTILFQLVKVQNQEKLMSLFKARVNFFKSQSIGYFQAGGRMI